MLHHTQYLPHGQKNVLASVQESASTLQEPVIELLLAKRIAFLSKLGCILQKISSSKNLSDEHFNATRMPYLHRKNSSLHRKNQSVIGSYRLPTHRKFIIENLSMIPSYFEIENLAIRLRMDKLGGKGLRPWSTTHQF